MIFIAILIHFAGHYLPLWINKRKQQNSTKRDGWRYILLKLSGTITDFTVAFFIILIITLAVKGKDLLNENAIYGVECDSLAKDIGFMDGDKIISINDKKVIRFFDIAKQIILEQDTAKVKIRRGENDTIINITSKERYKILTSKTHSSLFTPKTYPDTITNIEPKKLVYTETRRGPKEAFNSYKLAIKMLYYTYFPIKSEIYNKGGFISISEVTSIAGFFFILAISLLLIGLFNLLPLPGFGIGNTIIAIIENIRKKQFNRKKLIIIKTLSIILFVIFYFLEMLL